MSGLVLLDSILANSDFMSIYPDLDVPDFKASTLPSGVTAYTIYKARAYMLYVFHLINSSKEGLSQKNLIQPLPDSDGPQL